MLAVGVGDEYLPEVPAGADEFHDSADAAGVEFVEYVVKEQYRCLAAGVLQVVEDGEAQGDGEGLHLSLASEAARAVSVELHLQVVPVHAVGREAEREVFCPCLFEHIGKRGALELAPVGQGCLFRLAAHFCVVAGKYGRYALRPFLAGGEDGFRGRLHRLFHRFVEQCVLHSASEHPVARIEGFPVADQMGKVCAVGL